jgi:uncharacterized protein (DUF3084 family)
MPQDLPPGPDLPPILASAVKRALAQVDQIQKQLDVLRTTISQIHEAGRKKSVPKRRSKK